MVIFFSEKSSINKDTHLSISFKVVKQFLGHKFLDVSDSCVDRATNVFPLQYLKTTSRMTFKHDVYLVISSMIVCPASGVVVCSIHCRSRMR